MDLIIAIIFMVRPSAILMALMVMAALAVIIRVDALARDALEKRNHIVMMIVAVMMNIETHGCAQIQSTHKYAQNCIDSRFRFHYLLWDAIIMLLRTKL